MVVTVAELKEALRIDHTADDALLERLIMQAQARAEHFTRAEYFDAAAPYDVKRAVTLLAAHYYEHPDEDDSGITHNVDAAFERLLYPHRVEEKLF